MQAKKYSIKHWSKDDRPREKLLWKGAASLSNSELLAILIRNGIRDKSAVDLAKDLLKLGRDNIRQLARMTARDFMKVRGIGEVKAITIASALELGRRRQLEGDLDQTTVSSSIDVAHYLRDMLRDHKHEVFAVIFLNRANRVNHFEIVSKGGITGTVADPRIILKMALQEDAVSIVLCHNHPSGNLRPSKADEEMTKKFVVAAQYLDIRVMDHIIVSDEGFYSFADEGRMQV
ncbi:MAG: DNA repair protein RadC [Chitinophagaceae bacterium]